MQPNPEIQFTTLGITTNAAPNTLQATTVLAAPGAGRRYRVFGVDVHLLNNSPAGMVEGRIASATNAFGLYGLQSGQQVSDHINIMTQGIPMAENAAVTTRDLATVALMTYRVTLRYVEETV